MEAIEPIRETIDVIAVFQDGAIHPIAFKWHNRRYDHFTVTSTWVVPAGAQRVMHFTVFIDPNAYELTFHNGYLRWTLESIYHG